MHSTPTIHRVPAVLAILASCRVLMLFLLPLCSACAQAQPVLVEEVVRSTPDGRVRGFLATVDLTDPTVEIVVTAAGTGGNEADLLRTDSWRTSVGAKLAINANYFGTLPGNHADIIGLSVSNGTVISPIRQFGSNPDPAITFTQSRVANIGYIDSTTGVWDALAGVGPSTTDTDPGTMLVSDGVNTGATARIDPNGRNPRTAVGINQAGTRLYMVVIDGRQSGWSAGMTLPELADLLIRKGCYRAINLDGGGSSSFVHLTDAGPVQTNRPSDGTFRAVANHLGIKINPAGTVTDRTRRPIRGAWIRPPSTIASFESSVAAVASAGIQDIFIETLYWGRDTGRNNLPNFPHRFSFDYLSQAIVIAAKYGCRVHAWCETGYLDFGTSPSALLAANPGFVVKHRDPANTITGDIASQRFVNLGNPGVRTNLNQYFAALAANYPALEGIQADYHFFPLAASGAAVWSFDNWARTAYQQLYGVDPITEVSLNGTSFPTRWRDWNRANITESLVQLRESVEAVSTSPLLHCVAFADYNSATHTSKMIDLPGWGTTTAAETYIPMSYFTSLTTVPGSNPPRNQAIDTDVQRAQTALPNKRVVVGLANLTNQSRASVTVQLDTIKGRGIEEFVFFNLDTFVANPSMRTELTTWFATRATQLQGDVTATGTSNGFDGVVDARDRAWFNTVFTGTPVTRIATIDRCDLNRDGIVDARDLALLNRAFGRYHFGEDGVVDTRDIQALVGCFTPGPAPNPAILNLWDLNGDGAVNYADQVILHGYLTVPVPFDYDVNRDGVIDLEDLMAQNRFPIDINRDGVIDAADTTALGARLRASELDSMRGSQR